MSYFVFLLFCIQHVNKYINVVINSYARTLSDVLTRNHFVFVFSIYLHISGHTENLATGFQGSNTQAGEILMGFYSAMFAYDGW